MNWTIRVLTLATALQLAACGGDVAGQDGELAIVVAQLRSQAGSLRTLERQILQDAGSADRVREHRRRWDEGRRRLDELLAQARSRTSSAEQIEALERYASAARAGEARIERNAEPPRSDRRSASAGDLATTSRGSGRHD